MAAVPQEFYCATSGGGCGGYIMVNINMALNGVVSVICPKCGHNHQRRLKAGVLMEQGRHTSTPSEELCPNPAAWSKKARLPESKKRAGTYKERDAVVISEDPQKRGFMSELWTERFGGKVKL